MYVTVSRSIRRTSGGGRQETLQHLSNGWIPPQKGHLSEVQEKISSGHYRDESNSLIEDLRSDISLLAHAIRGVSALHSRNPKDLDPLSELVTFDESSLSTLFNTSERSLSTHRFSQMGKQQASILAQTLTSSASAEVLAAAAEESGSAIHPLEAFCAVSVRQLIPNLLAWNYPRLFAKAFREAQQSKQPLEGILLRVLGLSPFELTRALAQQWRLNTKLTAAVGYRHANRNPNLPSEVDFSDPRSSDALGRFCEISELLAHLGNPGQFPAAERDWKTSASDFERLVGHQETGKLQQQVAERAGTYLERVSTALGTSLFSSRSALARSNAQTKHQNAFLGRCPEALQETFEKLYQLGTEPEARNGKLHVLLNELIPAAGFSRGCIYLPSSTSKELTPAVSIGDSAKARYLLRDPHLRSTVSEAIFRDTPFRGRGTLLDGNLVSHVSASLGGPIELGVLLLEISRESMDDPDHDALLLFKAIRQCLHDCLRPAATAEKNEHASK